jgi:hypothetical protein
LARRSQKPFGVVVGDALDEAGQHFLGRWFRLRLHVDYRIIAAESCAKPSIDADNVDDGERRLQHNQACFALHPSNRAPK